MKRPLLIAFIAILFHPPGGHAQMKLDAAVIGPGTTTGFGNIQMLAAIGEPVAGHTNTPPITGDFGFCSTARDFFLGNLVPVMYASIDAHIVDRSVAVRWVVTVADGITGFNVYRRASADDTWERLNAEAITPAEALEYMDATVRPANHYQYAIGAVEGDAESLSPPVETTVPAWKSELGQNYPNPFNPATTIQFYLADRSTVSLRVYNVRGQLVRELIDGTLGHGRHEIQWDATSSSGMTVASGVYFYRLTAGKHSFTRRMMVLK